MSNPAKNLLFDLPTKIYMGYNILINIKAVKEYGKKALVVTGRNFALKSGIVEKVEAFLKEDGIESQRFCDVESDPCVETIDRGAKICRDYKCDCVVGIGGGSAMDAAKAIAIMAKNSGSIRDYFGEDKFSIDPLPIMAIPTTAGTGSEVARYAVIVDWSINNKKTISSGKILPKISILDPILTVSLSKELTGFTGMDAFSHALEGYLSTGADMLSDIFAKESMKIIIKNLPLVQRNPQDLELRQKMLFASMLAGMVINKTGTIIVHGMAYPIALKYHLQHGQANMLLLAPAIEYLYPHYKEKLDVLSRELGVNVVKAIKETIKASQLKSGFREAGIKKEDISGLAEAAVLSCDRAMKRMKVQVGVEDFRKIYEKAL